MSRPVLARLAERLDLPRDLVFDLPRITILGTLQLTVENHRGLVEFSPERVVMGMGRGRIVVNGEGLTIGVVQEEEITVLGHLQAVVFEA